MIHREKKQGLQFAFEVMDKIIKRGDSEPLGHQLSVTAQTIRSWCRPPQNDADYNTGRPGPLDRLRTIIFWLKSRDGNLERAFPIGHYVASLLNGIFIPSPPQASDDDSEVLQHMNTTLKETGEALEELRKAWFEVTPGRFSLSEKKKIIAEFEEAIAAMVHAKFFVKNFNEKEE